MIVGLTKALTKLATQIAGLAELSKFNTQQSRRLSARMTNLTVLLVEHAGTETKAKRFAGSLLSTQLEQLRELLNESCAFLEKFSNSAWYKRLGKATTYQRELDTFNVSLCALVGDIHLSIGLSGKQSSSLTSDYSQEDATDKQQDAERLAQLIQENTQRILEEQQALLDHQVQGFVKLQQGQQAFLIAHRETHARLDELNLNQKRGDLQRAEAQEQRKFILAKLASIQHSRTLRHTEEKTMPIDKRWITHVSEFDATRLWCELPETSIYLGQEVDEGDVIISLPTWTGPKHREVAKVLMALSTCRDFQPLVGICFEEEVQAIIAKQLPCTLASHLQQLSSELKTDWINDALLAITRALKALHTAGQAYRGLSLESVFLTAKHYQPQLSVVHFKQQTQSHWFSPEEEKAVSVLSESAAIKADTYHFGCLMRALYSKQGIPMPSFYSQLAEACCQPEPSARPDCKEIERRLSAYKQSNSYLYRVGCEAESDKNYIFAFQVYTQALSTERDCRVLFRLGMLYLLGQPGIQKDLNQAKACLAEVTESNNGPQALREQASYNLGKLYEKGFFGASSKDEAIVWYTQAAKLGSKKAEVKLASLRPPMR